VVREPNAVTQLALQDNQLTSKHRVLGLKPQLRLEWRGHDGQNETEQPDHSASLGDSITPSTRTRFSVHTMVCRIGLYRETELPAHIQHRRVFLKRNAASTALRHQVAPALGTAPRR
jgi:hypothetical protein